MRKWKWTKAATIMLVAAFVVAACSTSDDSSSERAVSAVEVPGQSGTDEILVDDGFDPGMTEFDTGSDSATIEGRDFGRLAVEPVAGSIDARIIRDGTVDLRIEPGTFGVASSQMRSIATDLGGYVSSGESMIEQYDGERYAVGWFTMQVPVDRFDDAVARVEGLGEPVSSSMSSQDVTEEYVDLEGRLEYWRDQEAFYSRLMDEATTIEDLVAVQTRMQDVLLNIEQIEGRLRYLDGRTTFATLTVGLTEVPASPAVATGPVGEGPIAQAFAQAGDVLLATVSFLIIAVAALIPLGIVAVLVYLLTRVFLFLRRRTTPAQSPMA